VIAVRLIPVGRFKERRAQPRTAPLETDRYAADALLRDGRSVQIRAIRPDDKERLREHFRSLGRQSVYNRFFSCKADLTDEELRYFTELDLDRHVGLFAVRQQEGREEILGVARYVVLEEEGPRRAEMAVAVSDEHQGRGIGTALLEHLARIALAHGIQEVEADILEGNDRMLRMLRHTGLPTRTSRGDGVVHLSLPVGLTGET
jgi:GNAT superfamily N-acetyltransferase